MIFEWIEQDWAEQIAFAVQICIAALLGGIVGLERESLHRPAGLRTHALLAASAALLTLLIEPLVGDLSRDTSQNVVQADPTRMVQAIVIGVSFLGAGTIFRSNSGGIMGLTTAASLLLVAGIGITVAVGKLLLAVAVAVLALVVLHLLRRVEPVGDSGE